MTTKLVIAAPDNSIHDALIYVEQRQEDGSWLRSGAAIVVPPRSTAEPIYLTASTRVVIEEETRATAEPHA
jgi:hypothetical protein